MATTITVAKKNSGVIGVEVVLLVEFGLGDALIVGVNDVEEVTDGELVGAWVTTDVGDVVEEVLGAWLGVTVGEFVGDIIGEVVGEAEAAA